MPEEATQTKKPSSMAAYRARNRGLRIDYYPDPAVAQIIDQHLAAGDRKVRAVVLDQLILAGHQHLSGKPSTI